MTIDMSLVDIPARVLLNRRTGVIAVTGDVEISPVVISARGLSITRIDPPPIATALDPVFTTEEHVRVNTIDDGLPTTDASLASLIAAMESIKIDFDTRVSVLYELKRLGVLHAELIEGTQ
jgi:flagellar P-ring protein precursor FlgI